MTNSRTNDYLKEWKQGDIVCRVIGGPFSNFNGYVGLPKTHPKWGKSYNELYEEETYIEVHGGLTFAEQGNENSLRFPNPKLWWFGFDTLHSGDYVDYGCGSGYEKQGHFWTKEEVAAEVESMAKQFAALNQHIVDKHEAIIESLKKQEFTGL
jgi:hypothetical protein